MWKLGKLGERHWKMAVHKMKVKIWKKGKNEIYVNVDEPQDAIKYLEEYYDIDGIEPPWKDKAVCVPCNQSIAWQKWVENKFRKSTLSCCEIIVAKCWNKGRKKSVIWIKHLNKPLLNASSRRQE